VITVEVFQNNGVAQDTEALGMSTMSAYEMTSQERNVKRELLLSAVSLYLPFEKIIIDQLLLPRYRSLTLRAAQKAILTSSLNDHEQPRDH
jgi:hypothetical protein